MTIPDSAFPKMLPLQHGESPVSKNAAAEASSSKMEKKVENVKEGVLAAAEANQQAQRSQSSKNVAPASPEDQMKKLQSLLGIFLPDSHEKTFEREITTKKQFLSILCQNDPESMRLMIRYAGKVPAMTEILQLIRDGFDTWKIESNAEQLSKQMISEDYETARQIAQVLNTLHTEYGEAALFELTYGSNAKGRSNIEKSFRKQINAKLTQTATQRPSRKITTSAIKKTAGLYKKSKKVKQVSSVLASSEVFKGIDAKGKAKVYRKLSKYPEPAIIEKLIWDIALVMGLEDQFTATRVIKIKNELASEQTALMGITPEQAKRRTQFLKRQAIIDATLTSIVIGHCDLHQDNMIVDPRGRIMFFDNTRSMPNSNGFVERRDGGIYPTYRSYLIGLEESFIPLTKDERCQMKERFEELLKKVDDVELYLKSPMAKSQLAKLPKEWWNQKEAIKAMRERIENSITVLDDKKNSQSLSLRDLVMESNPAYKLACAIVMIREIYVVKGKLKLEISEEKQLQYLAGTGLLPLGSLSLDKFPDYNLDIYQLKEKCKNEPFDKVLEWIVDQINVYPSSQYPPEERRKELKDKIDQFMKESQNETVKDFRW